MSLVILFFAYLGLCLAQYTATKYTDENTGIIFNAWSAPDGATSGYLTIGIALPQDALDTDANEFIGILKCASPNGKGTGWCGISIGGPMTQNLLLTIYPQHEDILTSFMYATGYVMPEAYTGDAFITQISSNITDDGYELIYRCQNCLSWNQNGQESSASTSSGSVIIGWCHGYDSPTNAECPAELSLVQHNTQGIFAAAFNSEAVDPSYTSWTALATSTVTGNCGGSSATVTATATSSTALSTTVTGVPIPTETFDYIVIGSGAGGIPLADRLSEAGKSVLLIEKGPPSSARWGGTIKPDWLADSNLTRFDVPGLCNQIWVDSEGIACRDTDQMAGCVVGGGTAVNAGLWWKPYSLDWDYIFPEGWKADDMQAATDTAFNRIPGTTIPSEDGTLYLQQGFDIISSALNNSGWTSVNALESPDAKNHTYTHTPYMFSHGERGGPMATYLVSASARDNFKLWTGTSVKRVIRQGGHVTGVEVEPYIPGGYSGVVNVTAGSGRVVLSAGTFGSAKILLRSGIGPSDQLAIVKSSTDGPTMIDSKSWIPLPVGSNLEDHTNTDIVVSHPDVEFYDFYAAYQSPITSDKELYLNERSGILAQSAPNIGPIFFDEIEGADGVVRQLQWTARVEGGHGFTSNTSMVLSQYLGRGSKSRGRMTITRSLNTIVSDAPYLKDKEDVLAVIQGIKNLKAALDKVEGLNYTYPAPGTSVEDFVNEMVVSYSNRRSNHWIGTNKMGTDDGRFGGSAVVDTNTKVYGTDNLFVVDASIFPGMVTTNPTSYIVTVAEHAAGKILALPETKGLSKYSQCGGERWNGDSYCEEPYTCTYQNDFYWQCLD
ncbi:hypothetical protein TD95_000828 [Thielaviopsis punctulata]|uniref:CBM1 domain-containing protein n=1 Tax=Thielaviopsis punctulata TaxID=72032 RepID=A0A0F4ZL77_9PEZI|nr:hypothetical protein TD95_000828 [Thielaviopsis punctulata]